MLRHRHTLGKGCQQADYPLIDPVEISRFIMQFISDHLLIIKTDSK